MYRDRAVRSARRAGRQASHRDRRLLWLTTLYYLSVSVNEGNHDLALHLPYSGY